EPSFDEEFFFQQPDDNNNNNGNGSYPDMTYFDAWPAQGELQNFQYSTKSPFVNSAYLDAYENAPPVSFITPSQTQIVASPQQPTCPADTQMFFGQEQSQPGIEDGRRRSGAKPRPVARSTASCTTTTTITPLRIDASEGSGMAPGMPASQGPAGSRTNGNMVPAREGSLSKQTRSDKRRSESDSSEDEDSASVKAAKHNHSVIERRYRDNLNGKINQLHRTLQATEVTSPLMRFDAPPSDPGRRVRKCDIMTKALQYVHRSELESRHMRDEIQRLQDQVRSLEKLIKCEDCTLLKNMRRMDLEKPC
ncbi:bHLH/Zip transcription factor, partial [Rhinocladiella similis]